MTLIDATAETPSVAPFSVEDLRARATAKLSLRPPTSQAAGRGNPGAAAAYFAGTAKPLPAAVLIPIVARPEGATLLLTLRATALSRHAGQIAFPGGRVDAVDANPVAAALREAEEEIGLNRAKVTPIGYLDPYFTGSGYRVLPIVSIVTPPLTLRVNPAEVEEAFEVPAQFLMEPGNHIWRVSERDGRRSGHYAMLFGDRNIWGATAGIVRNLYEKLYT